MSEHREDERQKTVRFVQPNWQGVGEGRNEVQERRLSSALKSELTIGVEDFADNIPSRTMAIRKPA
jgi:hypothetical protein